MHCRCKDRDLGRTVMERQVRSGYGDGYGDGSGSGYGSGSGDGYGDGDGYV